MLLLEFGNGESVNIKTLKQSCTATHPPSGSDDSSPSPNLGLPPSQDMCWGLTTCARCSGSRWSTAAAGLPSALHSAGSPLVPAAAAAAAGPAQCHSAHHLQGRPCPCRTHPAVQAAAAASHGARGSAGHTWRTTHSHMVPHFTAHAQQHPAAPSRA